jgi:hypothetical protein
MASSPPIGIFLTVPLFTGVHEDNLLFRSVTSDFAVPRILLISPNLLFATVGIRFALSASDSSILFLRLFRRSSLSVFFKGLEKLFPI